MEYKYKMPTWKEWSSVYCSKCYTWLGNYKGWFTVSPVKIELYCKKCTKDIQREQQKLENEKQ